MNVIECPSCKPPMSSGISHWKARSKLPRWSNLFPPMLRNATQVFTVDRISASLGQPLMTISPPTAAMLVCLARCCDAPVGGDSPQIGHQQGLEILMRLWCPT